MGKEIEVRHVLNNKDELMKWLNGHALSCARSHQIDTYYDNRYHSFVTHIHQVSVTLTKISNILE